MDIAKESSKKREEVIRAKGYKDIVSYIPDKFKQTDDLFCSLSTGKIVSKKIINQTSYVLLGFVGLPMNESDFYWRAENDVEVKGYACMFDTQKMEDKLEDNIVFMPFSYGGSPDCVDTIKYKFDCSFWQEYELYKPWCKTCLKNANELDKKVIDCVKNAKLLESIFDRFNYDEQSDFAKQILDAARQNSFYQSYFGTISSMRAKHRDFNMYKQIYFLQDYHKRVFKNYGKGNYVEFAQFATDTADKIWQEYSKKEDPTKIVNWVVNKKHVLAKKESIKNM